MLMKKMGKNIKLFRVAREESQVKFSKRIGMDPNYFGRIERGLVENVSFVIIYNIAKGLNVPIDTLIKLDFGHDE